MSVGRKWNAITVAITLLLMTVQTMIDSNILVLYKIVRHMRFNVWPTVLCDNIASGNTDRLCSSDCRRRDSRNCGLGIEPIEDIEKEQC